MRTLTPHFLDDPRFPTWQARAREARDKLLLAVAAGEKPADCFQEKIWQDFKKTFLMRPGGGKCAFCEGRYIAGAPDDCEHFRPKGGVTAERRKIENHPGYYWLAYEWQNLLLACRNCNSSHTRNYETGESHPGKLNEFPTGPAGARVSRPCEDCEQWWHELKQEQPLLLHPYFDQPEKHFEAARHGALVGLTDEGRETIKICDLNRPDLMADREREELRMIERFKRHLDGSDGDGWFSVDEPFSMYLNSRLHQRVLEAARKFGIVPGTE